MRKSWMWLWILPTDFIPALIWGFNSKYQPAWKVEDIKAEMARLATHGSASVMSEGLTVNLEERTATEFFKKKNAAAGYSYGDSPGAYGAAAGRQRRGQNYLA